MRKYFLLDISFFIVFLSSFLLIHVASAQIKIHKSISTEDGLVQGQVNVMIQDSKGYIWFGTYGGISKWDGKNFENYQSYNGLTSSQIMDIEEGADSVIYIAAYGGGVITYKNGILDTIGLDDGLATEWVGEIQTLKNGDILFAGFDGNISLLKEGRLTDWNPHIKFPKVSIWDIYEASDGTLYFATYKGGLLAYKNGNLIIYTTKDGLINNIVWTIAEESDGTIRIGTQGGISKFNNGKFRDLVFENKSITSPVFDLKIAGDGTIYYASTDGVIIEKDDKVKVISESNGLSMQEVWSILEDENGSLYLGTSGKGIDIFNKGKIITYNKQTGLPDDNVWSVLQDRSGKIYLGTDKGLVIKEENKFDVLTTRNGLTDDYIRALFEANDGSILVGTRNGLNIINNNRIINYNEKDGLIDNQIFDIAESKSGEIYLATREGVSIYYKGYFKNITVESGLSNNYVQTILISEDETIYYGTLGYGITIYKNNKYTQLTKENGLTDENIQTLYEYTDGSILIGTYEGGLNILKDGIIKNIDVEDGLSSNTVLSITSDRSGNIYLSTFKGVNILHHFASDSFLVRTITQKDGFAADDCNRESSLLDDEGNLWFGTERGVSIYNPDKDKPIKIPPKIYITGLKIYNTNYPIDEFLKNPVLSFDQNYLNFIYTGINLSAPKKIKFKYYLPGVDRNWVESNDNAVQYTNLDDGKYTFKVQAGNEWGYWSEPAKISFVINPAWWETWWFYLFVILSVASLFIFIISYRYKHLLAIEKVRLKISTDLHDDIGSGLSELSFLGEIINHKLPTNVSSLVKNELTKIGEVSRGLISSMSDIVWLVTPKTDSLFDLIVRLRDFYTDVMIDKNISFEIENLEELKKVNLKMESRQHLYLIFKEAINNCLKHSDCTKIVLTINRSGNIITIKLKDNGKGFKEGINSAGNGLKNMKERATLIGGNISIISSPSNGTTIKFTGKNLV